MQDSLVGQIVEQRYRIEAALGAGGMGAVYRARHLRVGREVAIKVLHDHLVQDPEMVARFEREAALAARLDHANVVSVLDVGETAAHQKVMVLELARGRTLTELLAAAPFSRDRVIALTQQLLAGLAHAHHAGLVHRDLKPDNIMVEYDELGREVPRIVDFGIAVLRDDLDGRLTAAGMVLGTPHYMAPEQAQGLPLDARCDLFALGVIVFEMLAGKLPFDGGGIEAAVAGITRDPPRIFDRAGVAVDPELEAFVRKLMARRRAERFPSAAAALDALARIARTTSERDAIASAPTTEMAIVPRPPRHRASRHRPGIPRSTGWWSSIGFLLGCALAGVTVAVLALAASG